MELSAYSKTTEALLPARPIILLMNDFISFSMLGRKQFTMNLDVPQSHNPFPGPVLPKRPALLPTHVSFHKRHARNRSK